MRKPGYDRAMRSNEIFSRMSPEDALAFLDEIHREAPRVEEIALSAAAGAFRLRSVFLRRQPRKRQAEWMRQALARNAMAGVAEEVLAEYFLEYHADLLVEWLDALGLEHEKGILKTGAPACPAPADLAKLVEEFRRGKEPARRELLMRAFAAQSAIEWPDLEALVQR
jgi:hypothetical protein